MTDDEYDEIVLNITNGTANKTSLVAQGDGFLLCKKTKVPDKYVLGDTMVIGFMEDMPLSGFISIMKKHIMSWKILEN